jgi:hypothetical protein
MIARVWKGWTKAEDADAYEKLLREVVYPGIQTGVSEINCSEARKAAAGAGLARRWL